MTALALTPAETWATLIFGAFWLLVVTLTILRALARRDERRELDAYPEDLDGPLEVEDDGWGWVDPLDPPEVAR